MVLKRDASCPLCGAKMQAAELLDACGEIIDTRLGVLACRCPHCQGHLEVVPVPDRVDIGYLVGKDAIRFDVVLSLPYDGLTVERAAGGAALRLNAPGRAWEFRE